MSFTYDPVNKYYSVIEKDNPKDRVEVEIGDAQDASTFHPQVKIKRWDNEINASIRLKHDTIPGNITYSDDGTKITWIKKQGQNEWKAVFYHRSDLDEGGFEFEVHLPAKPPVNYLEFTVNTKDLDWFYQPALTQQEIDEGASRPDNVIGSYAVYHKTKGGLNDAAGMEYKVGKAFHVYRPHVIDNNGNETWGTLELDEVNGILKISVDQAWLNSAVYPVIVDPTFGYTSNGGTNYGVQNNYFAGSKYTSSESGTVSDLTFYVSQSFGTPYAKSVITNSSKNILTNGVGNAVQVIAGNNWRTSSFSSSPSISAADYYLGINGGPTGTLSNFKYDSSGTSLIDTSNSYTEPADPTDGSDGTYKFSIYATYTASSSDLSVSASSTSTAVDVLPPWYADGSVATDTVSAEVTNVIPNNISTSSTSTLADEIVAVGGAAQASVADTSTLADAILSVAGAGQASVASASTVADSITSKASAGIANVADTSTVSDAVTARAGAAVASVSDTSTVSEAISSVGGGAKASVTSTSTVADQVLATSSGDNLALVSSVSSALDVVTAKGGNGVASVADISTAQDIPTVSAVDVLLSIVVSDTSTLADAITSVGGAGVASVTSTSTVADAVTSTASSGLAQVSDTSTVSESVSVDSYDTERSIVVASTSTATDTAAGERSGAQNVSVSDTFMEYPRFIYVDGIPHIHVVGKHYIRL